MKKVTKGLFSVILCALIAVGTASNAFAVVTPSAYDTDEYAVYVKNNMTINGSGTPVVVGGNAVVKNQVTGLNWSNVWVTGGFLYAGSAPEYENGNQWYRADVDARAFLAMGPYAGNYTGQEPNYNIPLKAFPTLANKGALPKNQTVNITESGSYTSFDVTSSGDTNVTITTTSADQLIQIRTNKLNIQQPLHVVGPGKVVFYVNEVTTGGTASLNAGGDPRNVLIYISGTKNVTFNNFGGNVNVFVGGTNTSQKITFDGGNDGAPILKGNVYTQGKVEIFSREVDGFVYAPNSDITLTGGRAIVKGKLVCKNLTIGNSGQVIQGDYYDLTEGVVSSIIQRPNYHVTTTASEGGTITAYNQDVEEGTVINVVATPAEGYRFVRFEGDQPDANGNITVSKALSIKAVFEKVVAPANYVNGLLGEYFDSYQTTNDTAIRVKRIDSQIAFNFGYAAPAGTESQIEAETFSERWTGFVKVPVTGDYTFKTLSDDGVTLIIDGQTLINRWDYVSMEYTIGTPIHLEAGKLYSFTLEHQQMPLYSAAFLFWEAEGVPMGLVPETAFYVTKETHDAYETPVFLNELSRTGAGINKNFFNGAEGLNGGVADASEIGIVNYSWEDGSPDSSVLGDTFSARMTGYIEGKFTETVTLEFIVDDGIRVWIDDNQIINEWGPHSDAIIGGSFQMEVGKKHKIVIEYNDIGGGATCIMRWKSDSQELQVVPIQYLYPET